MDLFKSAGTLNSTSSSPRCPRNHFVKLSSKERNCGGFNLHTKFSSLHRVEMYCRLQLYACCCQCDRWVRCTVWCTVTKATRRSKSSTENVKVVCIFTFKSTGAAEVQAPCSPLLCKELSPLCTCVCRACITRGVEGVKYHTEEYLDFFFFFYTVDHKIATLVRRVGPVVCWIVSLFLVKIY